MAAKTVAAAGDGVAESPQQTHANVLRIRKTQHRTLRPNLDPQTRCPYFQWHDAGV